MTSEDLNGPPSGNNLLRSQINNLSFQKHLFDTGSRLKATTNVDHPEAIDSLYSKTCSMSGFLRA